MYRPPLLLLCLSLFLAAHVLLPAFGEDRGSDGNRNAATQVSEGAAKVTLTGKLAPNSSPQPNQAPYVLLDCWGIAQRLCKPRRCHGPGAIPRAPGAYHWPSRNPVRDGFRPHLTVDTITDDDQHHVAFTAHHNSTADCRTIRSAGLA